MGTVMIHHHHIGQRSLDRFKRNIGQQRCIDDEMKNAMNVSISN
jgi:hypothetical protein